MYLPILRGGSSPMAIVAQIVTLLLALAGLAYDGVEKDEEGKRRFGKFGIPKLTKAGFVIVVLLLCSTTIAIWKERLSSKATDHLSETVDKLQQDNQSLQAVLQEDYKSLSKDLKTSVNELQELDSSASETVEKLDAASQWQARSLAGIEHLRLSRFAVSKVVIWWGLTEDNQQWSLVASNCPGAKNTNVEVTSIWLGSSQGCQYFQGKEPALLNLTEDWKTSLRTDFRYQMLHSLQLTSSSSPKALDVETQKANWFADPHRVEVQFVEPEISADWFTGRGIFITMGVDPKFAKLLPKFFVVSIEGDTVDVPFVWIEPRWSDVRGTGEFSTGPHLIKLNSEVLRKVASLP